MGTQSAVVTAPSVFDLLRKRYKDAYRHARFTIWAGNFVKGTSIILGLMMIGMSVAVANATATLLNQPPFSGSPPEARLAPFVLLVFGILLAIVVIVGGFVFGILICAGGQLTLTSIDSAVNSSPILTAEEKGQIAGIL